MIDMTDLVDRNKLRRIYQGWIPQLSEETESGQIEAIESCIEVLNDAIAIEAYPDEWVSVNDRPPDEHVTVLFYCGNLQKGYCELDVTKNHITDWFLSWDKTRFSPDEVTHWMPLPKPPKKRDAEKVFD